VIARHEINGDAVVGYSFQGLKDRFHQTGRDFAAVKNISAMDYAIHLGI
jgi:hypothetical protein